MQGQLSPEPETNIVVNCPECGRVMWAWSSHAMHGVLDRPSDEVMERQPDLPDPDYKGKSDARRRTRSR